MYKNLIISLVLVLIASIGGGMYYVDYVDVNVADAKRQAIFRSQRMEADWNTAEQNMSSRIAVLGNNLNNHVNDSQQTHTEHATSVDSLTQALEILDGQHNSTAMELSRALLGQEEIRNQVQTLQDEAAITLELLGEMNNDLILLRTRLEAVEAQRIGTGLSETEEVMRSIYSKDSALVQFQDCPSTALNRKEQLPTLQRAMDRSTSSGMHNVIVKFNIQEDGSTEVRGTESATAPSSLVRAVGRYMSSLVFVKQETPLIGCEMVVKLDMGTGGKGLSW